MGIFTTEALMGLNINDSTVSGLADDIRAVKDAGMMFGEMTSQGGHIYRSLLERVFWEPGQSPLVHSVTGPQETKVSFMDRGRRL